jgi:thymidylate kinase
MSGLLIAFEGLDQSGKETQAELLRDRLKQTVKSCLMSFPDYGGPL